MKKVKAIAFLLLVVVIGFGLGSFMANSDFIERIVPKEKGLPPLTIILMLLSLPFVIGVHELGHLLTGLAQGFRFEMFVVGPLGIKRNGLGTISPYFNTDISTYGGLAATSPQNYNESVAPKLARVLLAGPLTSFLFVVICLVLTPLVVPPYGIVFIFMALVSFALFAATTLPEQTGVFYTDRKRYQRLSNAGKEREIEMALFRTISADASGKGPEEADLVLMTTDKSEMFQYFGYFYLCQLYRDDKQEFSKVRDKMIALEPKLPKALVMQFQKEMDKL